MLGQLMCWLQVNGSFPIEVRPKDQLSVWMAAASTAAPIGGACCTGSGGRARARARNKTIARFACTNNADAVSSHLHPLLNSPICAPFHGIPQAARWCIGLRQA